MDFEELLSRVKTYYLTLIGWVTATVVRARTIFSLVALSWEPYSKSRCFYGNEDEVVCCSLLWHDFLSRHFFVPFTL